ncbi:hypothetical protein HPB51_017176 [Rhipicephalus microplus]|uniref:PiggyBac transposable element-derived protein domain-containing protein n=1 Tax=Rhipicephalus microplus TaxID=6941 RepID=A0A9J6EAT0_RHIMP|nr:hypothetical protein HPB51_017176 [Rhipicephalus microplus]
MLSNFHDPSEVVEVNRTLSNGAKVGVTCPKVVSDYNKFMGGVDRFDQKRNAYMCDHRSKKGWYRLFYYLLDAAVVNAFIQHCHFTPNEYLWFRLALGRELISGQSFRKKTAIPAFQHKKRGRQSGQKMVGVPGEIRFHKGDHHPVKTTGRKTIDFTGCSAISFVLIILLLIFGIVVAIFPSRYIVMDTQLIVGGAKRQCSLSPEDYIAGALMLYLDAINLFLFILQILNQFSGDES